MAEGDNVVEFDYLSTTKVLLGITSSEKDGILQVYISKTIQSVLNYCNISVLPSALNYLVCDLTSDSYRDSIALNGSGDVVGNISSISEAGRTLSFSSAIQTSLDDKISKTKELNKYKKLYRVE